MLYSFISCGIVTKAYLRFRPIKLGKESGFFFSTPFEEEAAQTSQSTIYKTTHLLITHSIAKCSLFLTPSNMNIQDSWLHCTQQRNKGKTVIIFQLCLL